jgi:hypothetical protein
METLWSMVQRSGWWAQLEPREHIGIGAVFEKQFHDLVPSLEAGVHDRFPSCAIRSRSRFRTARVMLKA